MNIAGNLENAAFYFPELSAVIDGDREFTYAALNRESDHIASALRALGIHAGDHLALCAPNSYEWLAFYFGTLKAGAVAVTFSHLLKGNELARIMDDCKPRMVFTADEKLEDLKNLRTRAYLDFVVCDSGDISYARLKTKGSGDFITVERRRLDIAAILYTGGTTGTPKGALLSHENIGFSTHNVAYYERANEQDAALCFHPHLTWTVFWRLSASTKSRNFMPFRPFISVCSNLKICRTTWRRCDTAFPPPPAWPWKWSGNGKTAPGLRFTKLTA
jgi:long-chain acyl-CoA synthetase